MAPRRGGNTETDRKILTVVSDCISGRRTKRRTWKKDQRKLMAAVAKVWNSIDEAKRGEIEENIVMFPWEHTPEDLTKCIEKVEEVGKEVIVIGDKESADEFNKPLLAEPDFSWTKMAKETFFLMPFRLEQDLTKKLAECPSTEGDAMASLFFGKDLPEWFKKASEMVFSYMLDIDTVTNDMSDLLITSVNSYEKPTRVYWRKEYEEAGEKRRVYLGLANANLNLVMAYVFLCETLSSIPNQWPGYGVVAEHFREKRELLEGLGRVMDVEARTVRRPVSTKEETGDEMMEYVFADLLEIDDKHAKWRLKYVAPECSKLLEVANKTIVSMKNECPSAHDIVMACFKRAVGDDGADSTIDFDAWYSHAVLPRMSSKGLRNCCSEDDRDCL